MFVKIVEERESGKAMTFVWLDIKNPDWCDPKVPNGGTVRLTVSVTSRAKSYNRLVSEFFTGISSVQTARRIH